MNSLKSKRIGFSIAKKIELLDLVKTGKARSTICKENGLLFTSKLCPRREKQGRIHSQYVCGPETLRVKDDLREDEYLIIN